MIEFAKPTPEAVRRFKRFDFDDEQVANCVYVLEKWLESTYGITPHDVEKIRSLYSITPFKLHRGPVFRNFITKKKVFEEQVVTLKTAKQPAQSWTMSIGSAIKFAYNDGTAAIEKGFTPVIGQLVSGKVWEVWNYDWASALAKDIYQMSPKHSNVKDRAANLISLMREYADELEVGLYVPKNSKLRVKIVAVLDWKKGRPR